MRAVVSKFLASLMTIVLALALVPAAALADDGFSGSGTQADPWLIGAVDEASVTAYMVGTELIISGTGAMASMSNSSTGMPWYYNRSGIVRITINEGVTSVGANAFQYCTLLSRVSFPETLESIGASAFWFCNNLSSVSIPASVTSISGYAFANCENLNTIYFFHTSEQTIDVARSAFHSEYTIAYTYVYLPYLTKLVNTTLRNYDWTEGGNSYRQSITYYNYYDEDEGGSTSQKAQFISITKAERSLKAAKVKKKAKKLTFKVKYASTALKAKAVGKKAKKALTVKASGKNKVVVKVKKGAAKGTYKVKVWAKATSAYKASIAKYITIVIK